MLVLAGHGSMKEGGPDDTSRRHAATLGGLGLFKEVRAVTLAGGPTLAETLAGVAGHDIYVVPLFMSDGHAFRQAVTLSAEESVTPAGGRRVCVTQPLGLRPELSLLILGRAQASAARDRFPLKETTVLLVGHGSPRDPASRKATEAHAKRIRRRRTFGTVVTAFIEEPPFLGDVLKTLAGPTIAVGLFASAGRHAEEDAPGLIAAHGRGRLRYLGAIGADPEIPAVVLYAVAEADRLAARQAD